MPGMVETFAFFVSTHVTMLTLCVTMKLACANEVAALNELSMDTTMATQWPWRVSMTMLMLLLQQMLTNAPISPKRRDTKREEED